MMHWIGFFPTLKLSNANPRAAKTRRIRRLDSEISTLNKQIEKRLNGFLEGLEASAESNREKAHFLQSKLKQADECASIQKLKHALETQSRVRDSIHIRILQEKVDLR